MTIAWNRARSCRRSNVRPTLDVVPGRGGMVAPEGSLGECLPICSRPFTDQQQTALRDQSLRPG